MKEDSSTAGAVPLVPDQPEAPATLRPCPFCNTINTEGAEPLALSQRRSGSWYVNCDGCLADGPTEDREAEAIAAWNRRSGEEHLSPLRERIAVLEEALRAAKRLCDNINEFGACTDAEIYDAADTAIRAALSNQGRL